MRNATAWIGFNRTTDSSKIEVIVLGEQKPRELRRIRTTGLAVYLDDCTVFGHLKLANLLTGDPTEILS